MSAGLVAGVTRARAMTSRRLGAARCRELAAEPTLAEALRYLAATPYRRDLDRTAALGAAQRAVSATLLWHLRVLAGWQTPAGAASVRLLASGFEIANVEGHLRAADVGGNHQEYRLGSLATAWAALSRTRSPAELRAALAASVWGDPGADSPAATAVGMRISAAARIVTALPDAAPWAAARAALLVARETFLLHRRMPEPTARRAAGILGARSPAAAAFADFRRHLPPAARWAVEGIDDPADLWRAEARWWTRVEADGFELLRRARFDVAPVVGAVAVLGADAHRVRAALEVAARGGGPLEAFDALV